MLTANTIHDLRIRRGLSINALAELSGVGRNKITRMELGQDPSVGDLRSILQVLEPNQSKRAKVWKALGQ